MLQRLANMSTRTCYSKPDCLWFQNKLCCCPNNPGVGVNFECAAYKLRTVNNIIEELSVRLKPGDTIKVTKKEYLKGAERENLPPGEPNYRIVKIDLEIVDIGKRHTILRTIKRPFRTVSLLNLDVLKAISLPKTDTNDALPERVLDLSELETDPTVLKNLLGLQGASDDVDIDEFVE